MNNLNDSVLFLSKYINQLETNIKNCLVPSLVEDVDKKRDENEEKDEAGGDEDETEDNVPVMNEELAFLKPYQESEEIRTPQSCIWDFMAKEELQEFLSITNRSQIREKLEERLGKTPVGFSKIVAIEYLMDVTNYCRKSTFDVEQAGSILSMFYWTHRFFTTNLFVCPEDVYSYFREFLVFHCLFYPPTHFKIFTIEEAKVVLNYFCRLYLRHLPLVRMLTLPNFAFELVYVLEPEMKPDKHKKGKDKGKAKGGGKKGKKK